MMCECNGVGCKTKTSIDIVNVGTKGHCDYNQKEVIKLDYLDLDSYGVSILGDKWFDVVGSKSDIWYVISFQVEEYNKIVKMFNEMEVVDGSSD